MLSHIHFLNSTKAKVNKEEKSKYLLYCCLQILFQSCFYILRKGFRKIYRSTVIRNKWTGCVIFILKYFFHRNIYEAATDTGDINNIQLKCINQSCYSTKFGEASISLATPKWWTVFCRTHSSQDNIRWTDVYQFFITALTFIDWQLTLFRYIKNIGRYEKALWRNLNTKFYKLKYYRKFFWNSMK